MRDGAEKARPAGAGVTLTCRPRQRVSPLASPMTGSRGDPYAVASQSGTEVDVAKNNWLSWSWIPAFAGMTLRRQGRHVLVVEVLDRRKRGERLGRERDRLAVAVRRCRRRACRRFARQRVEGRADAAAQLDQLAFAAGSGDRKCERIKVASA